MHTVAGDQKTRGIKRRQSFDDDTEGINHGIDHFDSPVQAAELEAEARSTRLRSATVPVEYRTFDGLLHASELAYDTLCSRYIQTVVASRQHFAFVL